MAKVEHFNQSVSDKDRIFTHEVYLLVICILNTLRLMAERFILSGKYWLESAVEQPALKLKKEC
jgi:hypothetical protein